MVLKSFCSPDLVLIGTLSWDSKCYLASISKTRDIKKKKKIIYLKLGEVFVIKVCCSIAVSVVKKLDLSSACVLGILNKFLAREK